MHNRASWEERPRQRQPQSQHLTLTLTQLDEQPYKPSDELYARQLRQHIIDNYNKITGFDEPFEDKLLKRGGDALARRILSNIQRVIKGEKHPSKKGDLTTIVKLQRHFAHVNRREALQSDFIGRNSISHRVYTPLQPRGFQTCARHQQVNRSYTTNHRRCNTLASSRRYCNIISRLEGSNQRKENGRWPASNIKVRNQGNMKPRLSATSIMPMT